MRDGRRRSWRCSRRRSGALVAALASVAALTAGCGVPFDDSPRGIAQEEVPEDLRGLDPVDPRPPSRTQLVDLWYVRDGVLVPSPHRVDVDAGPQAVLEELLSGPTEREQGLGLRTAIADRASVVGVEVVGGRAIVSLDDTFADLPTSDQVLGVAQLVLSLTDLRGVGLVRFEFDGVAIPVPLPNGEAAERSISRDDVMTLTTTPA